MQRNKTYGEEGDSIMHFMVPLIAMTLYALMTMGGGVLRLSDGREFFYGRYIDWSITTPLLLLSLISTVFRGTDRKRPGLIAGLIGSDVYMIATGFVAALTNNPTEKWVFYLLSCGSFVAIYALLFGPFRKLSQDSPDGGNYRSKSAVLSIIWFAYPIVFLFGQEGLRYWSPAVDATLFTILDLTAKVLYGLWAVSLAKASAPARQTLPASGSRLASQT